jgi:hypothetical protein
MSIRARWIALIAGLCIAALVAIAALLTGDFGDTHARVVLSSLGFSIFTATAAAGDSLRRRAGGAEGAVGGATIAASAVAFGLLVFALWAFDLFEGDDGAWQAFGVAALLTLCGSHASVVLAGRRRDDSGLVTALVFTSIACATFDTLVGNLAILEVFDDVSEGFIRVVAALFVVMLLTTALPPILRRMGGQEPDPFGRSERLGPRLSRDELSRELEQTAERLERADSAAKVHREAAALRELAARAGRDQRG